MRRKSFLGRISWREGGGEVVDGFLGGRAVVVWGGGGLPKRGGDRAVLMKASCDADISRL